MLLPWKDVFLDLHRQTEELFDELIYRPWAITGRSAWRPALDLHEMPDAYLVEIDLPGVAPEAVRVLVSERELTVTGQRSPAPSADILLQRCERRCGSFQRTLSFGQAIEPTLARAESRNGVCRIFLPKKQRPAEAKQAPLDVERPQSIVEVAVT